MAAIGGAAAWFFLGRSKTPAPLPKVPPKTEEKKPNVVVVPSAPKSRAGPDVIRDFDLFIVPIGTSLSDAKFLVCKFSTISKSPAVNNEIDHKMLLLRDAVFFYLNGKSADYLLDSGNAKEIKQNLVDILNDYLQRGKLEDVLLDSYLAY